jgi:cation:H+ antiporter
MVLVDLIVFIVALGILIKASDFFVDSAERIANYLNISSYIIGFTLVAIGTSLPELVSSIAASIYNSPGLVVGNIVGSNIANIGLILGCTAIIGTITNIKKRVFYKEGFFLIGISVILLLFSLNFSIGRIEGIILLLLFIAYSFYIIQFNIFKRLYETIPLMKDFIEYRIFKKTKKQKIKEGIIKENKPIFAILKEIAIITLSCAAMIFAVKYLIPSAKNLALGLGISETIVGITMLAVGTSLPELMVAISAVRKGLGDLLIGTIIGSNISNILLVGGSSAILSNISISPISVIYFIPFMILLTISLLAFIKIKWELKRLEGVILVLLYFAFIVSLYFLK